MNNNTKPLGKGEKNQKGYTLLEYCMGAAMLIGIVWAGMTALGGSLSDFLSGLAGWLDANNPRPPQ